MSERPEERLGDSNILDTVDFEAILRDNAGLARMVEHYTNMKVFEAVADALETAEDGEFAYERGYADGEEAGYEAGVQSMRDRLAETLDATVTRNG